jgi:RNA polymerase sigma-70 factor (ECF subfamily)
VTRADDSVDDRELLARHNRGDNDAFRIIVERHRDRLWRVALRTLGNSEDAADAVQDALISAFRSAGNFRGDSAVSTWLHRIVVNACLDQARRRASRPVVALASENVAAEPVARDAIAERETAAEVLAALRRLPPEQAAAVVLVDVEGYPVAEVAEILSVPTGTVKSRCARARARLAESLRDLDRGNTGTTAAGNPATSMPVQPMREDGEETQREQT